MAILAILITLHDIAAATPWWMLALIGLASWVILAALIAPVAGRSIARQYDDGDN